MNLEDFWPQKDAPALPNAKQFIEFYKNKKIASITMVEGWTRQ